MTDVTKHMFVYLPDLSCSMWDLLVVAYGIEFPDQGLNLGPLHCKCRASGPSGKHFNMTSEAFRISRLLG